MNMTVDRVADPIELKDAEKQAQQVESFDRSLQQIESRAQTKTEVLAHILERDEVPSFRHWGLNE